MAIEVEYFTLTGMQGNFGETGALALFHPPSTGPNGLPDLAIDPIDGPAQVYNTDFGVTYLGATGVVIFNLLNSDIKNVLLGVNAAGQTGPLTLRTVYNYIPLP